MRYILVKNRAWSPSSLPFFPSLPSVTFFTSYCTVLYCTVLYCTVLYCTVLYCTVLYYDTIYYDTIYNIYYAIYV